MLVAIAASPRLLLRISNSLDAAHQIVVVDSEAGTWEANVSRSDVLVLESGEFPGSERALLERIRHSPPRRHVVLCTSLHPADVRLVKHFVRAGVNRVLIAGVDDGPAQLRAAIEGEYPDG